MSDPRGTLIESAELVIRPSASGWSSAGGVPDVEPRFSHSSGPSSATPRTPATAAEYLRSLDIERDRIRTERALIELEARTDGRQPNRSERRLAAHYRRLLGITTGDQA